MFIAAPRDWGNIVRDRRVELGLTQEELGARVGRARQWIVRFESGHARSANLESLMRLLDALDLGADVSPLDSEDPDHVLAADGEPKRP